MSLNSHPVLGNAASELLYTTRPEFMTYAIRVVAIALALHIGLFWHLGAWFCAASMFVGLFVLTPATAYLHARGKQSAAKLLFFASFNFYILATALGMPPGAGFEQYFVTAVLVGLMVLGPSGRLSYASAFGFPLLAWVSLPFLPTSVQRWGFSGFPLSEVQWLPTLNFLGAYGMTAIFLAVLMRVMGRLHAEKLDESAKYAGFLQTSAQRTELILEGAGLGAWDWNLVTNEVHFDRRWYQMLGLPNQEGISQLSTWESRVHPDDKDSTIKDIQRHLEGDTPFYENTHRMLHADGHWVWILDRGRISGRDSSGKPTRMSGTHLDVTRLKDIEQKLESAQRVAKIGSWDYDLRTGKVNWTRQVYDFFPQEYLSGDLSLERILEVVLPEDRGAYLAAVRDCVESGKPYKIVFRHCIGDRILWLEGLGQPRRNDSGQIIELHGTVRDITEQMESEKVLELERSKSIQSAKLASLGEMSAGIAHEINNPLAIIGAAATMIEKYPTDTDKILQKTLSIQKSVQRISKIVNGLRKFSRSTESKHRSEHPLSEILSDVMTLTEAKAKRHGTLIELSGQTSSTILCDEVEIAQVLVNLVNNAIDAIKNSSGEKWVRVKVFEDAHALILQIRDSGKGIPDHIAKKLFQPFFTTKKVGEGTGLGLSIAQGILKEHGATIEVLKNEPNTCFEIRFEKAEALRAA